jgi:hypothetical protein
VNRGRRQDKHGTPFRVYELLHMQVVLRQLSELEKLVPGK